MLNLIKMDLNSENYDIHKLTNIFSIHFSKILFSILKRVVVVNGSLYTHETISINNLDKYTYI